MSEKYMKKGPSPVVRALDGIHPGLPNVPSSSHDDIGSRQRERNEFNALPYTERRAKVLSDRKRATKDGAIALGIIGGAVSAGLTVGNELPNMVTSPDDGSAPMHKIGGHEGQPTTADNPVGTGNVDGFKVTQR